MRARAIGAWAARHPVLVDAALAGVLAALLAPPSTGGGGMRWLLLAGLTAPLVWRRRAPLAVFGVLALVAFVQWLTTDPVAANATLLLALYSVAAYERRRWGFALAFAIFELGALLATISFATSTPVTAFLTLSAFIVAASSLGIYVRTRHEHIAALTERARQLERERDQQGQLAIAADRARIARELHDVVAHNLTVMVALADGAQLVAEHAPGEADAAMRSVSATGREALGEMRRLLGVLRDADGDEGDARHPQPGLDQLDALVDQVRAAGLATRLTRTGEPVPLSQGAQLTVYRVVQEALTNTLKHARSPSLAEVRLHYGDGALALEVTDDGGEANGAARPHGFGLAGMRERLTAYGASVEAGPRPQGGWQVRTRLPLGR